MESEYSTWPVSLVCLVLTFSAICIVFSTLAFIRPLQNISKVAHPSDIFRVKNDVSVAGNVQLGDAFTVTDTMQCEKLQTESLSTPALNFRTVQGDCQLNSDLFPFYTAPKTAIAFKDLSPAETKVDPSGTPIAFLDPVCFTLPNDPSFSYWLVRVIAKPKPITDVVIFVQLSLWIQSTDGASSLLLDQIDANTNQLLAFRSVQLQALVGSPTHATDGTALTQLVLKGSIRTTAPNQQTVQFETLQCQSICLL